MHTERRGLANNIEGTVVQSHITFVPYIDSNLVSYCDCLLA